MKRTLLSIALLVAATSVSAESWTYRGTLNDGGKPANGSYDLQVTLLNEAKSATISGPVTFYSVQVVDGSFAVDVDFGIDLANAPVMSLKTEVQQGASGYVALGEPTRFDPKAALAGICWDTTGNATISPATEYVGTTSSSTLVLRSGGGVAINLPGQVSSSSADLVVGAKSTGDGDADLRLESRTGKFGSVYVRDSNGNYVVSSTGATEFFGGFSTAVRNNGLPVHIFDGRLQSKAAGGNPTDTSGGMWMDDERAMASYVGRGDNVSNFTGFFSATTGWNLASFDDGALSLNSQTQPGTGVDVQFNPKSGTDPDVDLVLQTRNNESVRMYLSDSTGTLWIDSTTLNPGEPRLRMGGASLSNGGTWTNASSRSLKTGFAAINPLEMLGKVVALPITSWVYKSSEEGTHVGPVAEDFKAAFGLAGDGKSISTVDADGVALAAIQGLNLKLETENAALKARLDALEAKLK